MRDARERFGLARGLVFGFIFDDKEQR
jgi:hypothetical protein